MFFICSKGESYLGLLSDLKSNNISGTSFGRLNNDKLKFNVTFTDMGHCINSDFLCGEL